LLAFGRLRKAASEHVLQCGIGVPPLHFLWEKKEYRQLDLHCWLQHFPNAYSLTTAAPVSKARNTTVVRMKSGFVKCTHFGTLCVTSCVSNTQNLSLILTENTLPFIEEPCPLALFIVTYAETAGTIHYVYSVKFGCVSEQ
jgi:hypothetical protein